MPRPPRSTIAALALLAVLAATGCGSFNTTLNHLVDPTPSPHPTPNCHTLFERWNHPTDLKKILRYQRLQARIDGADAEIDSAVAADNLAGVLQGIRRVGHALYSIPRMPYCADPHGYFARMIAKINAAGDNSRSANSVEGLLPALAPLRRVPILIRKLSRELKQTAGVKPRELRPPPPPAHTAAVTAGSPAPAAPPARPARSRPAPRAGSPAASWVT